MNDLVNHLRIQWVVEGGGGEGEMQVMRSLRLNASVWCVVSRGYLYQCLGALISVG